MQLVRSAAHLSVPQRRDPGTLERGRSGRYAGAVPENPETHYFKDDGTFPNSHLPVLLYAGGLKFGAQRIEQHLLAHKWFNSWRNGVYSYHHYHSIAHEVLVVYAGSARLHLGGPQVGKNLRLETGDVLVIPAGVSHQCVQAQPEFAVVGAYPHGANWDIQRGHQGERPAADGRIAQVPLPDIDPVHGPTGPLLQLWTYQVSKVDSESGGKKADNMSSSPSTTAPANLTQANIATSGINQRRNSK